ncbi:MAG: hypothetical protein KZQ99_15065 [Candidatus Thiodiazotropha sp. (ex Dulcina madagascariensis)]|nr:hypothetical protein [Candidatus Thiodiazotropha sp. (ex Dulcina madagascariensis)]
MTQAFDMRRLHQGCGESLQSNLPGLTLIRRAPIPRLRIEPSQMGGKVRREAHNQRDESHCE